MLGLEIPEGHVVHHKDENRLNDNPLNLQILPRGAHHRLHQSLPSDGLRRKRISVTLMGHPVSEETRRKSSQTRKERFASGYYGDRFVRTPEWNAKIARAKMKLTPEQMLEAKKLRADGMNFAEISRYYGLQRSTVRKLFMRMGWPR